MEMMTFPPPDWSNSGAVHIKFVENQWEFARCFSWRKSIWSNLLSGQFIKQWFGITSTPPLLIQHIAQWKAIIDAQTPAQNDEF
jgi:hypothetical protein